MNDQIKETASAGSVGAGSVATAPARMGTVNTRRLKSFMVDYYKRLSNRLQLKVVNLYKMDTDDKVEVVKAVNENFNLDSVFAQLKGFENANSVEPNEVTTYGVEDDKGNLMKVTVLNTQAEDFEAYISAYLSTLKDFDNQGIDLEEISLAELLYKLKDLFDIRDVEFPNIPDDIVYNADEASDNVVEPSLETDLDPSLDMPADDMGMEGDMDMDMDMGGEGELGDGEELDLDVDADLDVVDGEGSDLELDDEFADDESVEDFEEMPDGGGIQSLLTSLLDMLSKTAEKEKAQAEAEAEKARAEQAEWSAKAVDATLANKEEIIAMQAEKDEQKKREKEAKKQADLATYRYKKSKGMVDDAEATFEWFEDDSILLDALLDEAFQINEEESIDDPIMLRRVFNAEMQALRKEMAETQDQAVRASLQKRMALLQRKFAVKRQEAEARKEEEEARAKAGDERESLNIDSRPEQGMGMTEGYVVEEISEEEYNLLEEGAKRQFKRYGNKFVRKFRCYGGPKSGRVVSKMSDCGVRKDPRKVRQGKRASRMKKGQRIRKTALAKKKSPSLRLVRMNKNLRGNK